MMLSTLLQCCIVIAMQIKLTGVVVVVVVDEFSQYAVPADKQRKHCLLHCLWRFSCPSSILTSQITETHIPGPTTSTAYFAQITFTLEGR